MPFILYVEAAVFDVTHHQKLGTILQSVNQDPPVILSTLE